jgi:flavin reductase (DIM6/NTAB) family NADH-FMN oxidoreductase RutF
MIAAAEIKTWPDRTRTTFVNSLWGPRPAWLMGTQSPEGIANLALFSNIIHIGANPPLVGILFRPPTVPRHSYENLMANRQLTLNSVTPALLGEAHHCAARWEHSEFDATGLTPVTYPGFDPPGVAESPITLGLTLVEKCPVQANGTVLVVAELQWVDLKEHAPAEDGLVPHGALKSIAAVGLDAYYTLQAEAQFDYPKPERLPVPKKLNY